jgi:hypothetical protein
MTKHKRFLERILGVGCALFLMCAAKIAVAQNVTQGYQTTAALQKGMIVALDPVDATRVVPLAQGSATNMLGVVVDPGDAPVSLSNNDQATQVYVATYGQYNVLVSTQNGAIKTGDLVSISSLEGVGAKANSTDTTILGKALQSFDGKSTAVGSTTLNGTTVQLGRIIVDISVAHNPIYQAPVAAGVPHFLARAAQYVTNKPVSAVRLYSSLAIFSLSTVIAASLLYSAVRNSVRAVGRNPLAKHLIMRNLLQVVLIALIVFIIGLLAVYLLLKI